ncbi:MAG: hypothetical protein KGL75_12100 [Acidobacteriota bacterium]|nr:hypothetical protein [Acidobacteriota bacterium]
MRRITLLILIVLCAAAIAAEAQQILPSSFAGWSGTVQPGLSQLSMKPTRTQAGTTARQQSAAVSEYGFVSGESGSYEKGADSLRVNVYRMKDPSGAYGLLTYLRTPGMEPSTPARHAFLSENQDLLLTGNVVLDVQGKDLRRHQGDLKALLQSVSAHAEQGALPTLWEQLPAKQMVAGTDRYVLGPRTLDQFFPLPIGGSVGFSNGAEAELARYRLANSEATILLIDLPTPQIAIQTLEQLAGKFNVNGSKPGNGSPLYAKRLITTLAIVAGAPTDAEGRALLDEVQNTEVLTWNEPAPKSKQADIGTIVVGTIVGTGIICAFSLVAGLAFGGFRLAVKRILPGKVFDRARNMEVIQLGLSSKPINPDDFYDRSGPRIKLGEVEKNLPERIALRLFR